MIDSERRVWGQCPDCGRKLRLGVDPATRERMLFCEGYPARCEYRRTVPPEVEMIEAGAQMLPGFE